MMSAMKGVLAWTTVAAAISVGIFVGLLLLSDENDERVLGVPPRPKRRPYDQEAPAWRR